MIYDKSKRGANQLNPIPFECPIVLSMIWFLIKQIWNLALILILIHLQTRVSD